MTRRVPRLVAWGVLASVLSCGGEPTAPEFLPTPPSPPPQLDLTGGGGGGKEGTVPLPIPLNNAGSGFGRVYPFPVVDYAAGDFVRIQIDGLIVTEVNTDCFEQELPVWWAGGAWGPWGSPNGEFVASAYYDASHPMATDPVGIGTSRKVAFGYFDSPGTAYAGRLGGGGLCPLPGLLFSGEQTVQYEVYPAAGVSASKTFVVKGDSTAASADSHWDVTSPIWLFQPNDTTPSAKGTHFAQQVCAGALSCNWAPAVSGRIYLTGQVMGLPVNATGPIIWVRDSVPEICSPAPPPGSYEPQGTAGPGCPPPEDPATDGLSLVISSVGTSGHGSSFLTLNGENQLSLVAQVAPAELGGDVVWTFSVLTPRLGWVQSPTGGSGTHLETTVPAQPSARYGGYTHEEALAARDGGLPIPNALHFRAVARVAEPMTGTTVSDSAEVLQDEVDAIREEYVAFGTSRVPARGEFGTARADNLSPSEINKADFSVYIADEQLLSGFEDVRATLGQLMDREVFLTVNSVYRNPVHHRVHERSTTVDSQHQYGTAIDLRIWDQGETRERFFGLVKLAAHDAAGCFEPEKAIRAANEQGVLTHAHIDWRGNCPNEWR